LYGLPESIILDRGVQFTVGIMKKLNELLEIQMKLSIAYHPQIDRQTERVNQKLKQYLRVFIDHRQEQWSEWLETAEFIYNNKIHSATKTSLFKANYNQDPRIGFKGKNKENPGKSKSSTGEGTERDEEIYRQKARESRGIQNWRLSTIKYKGSQIADGRKEIGEVNRMVCGTLQGQENYLNQCYRIRTT